ncbi:hypothetical protein C0992_013247 [Termitomyces sp. T32_za158]|nr:hypothetical protein C0992_013247 [Termitomyces sp. T32_za158]
MKEKSRRSGKEPQVRLKSPGKVLDLESELDSSDEEEDGSQRVPRADSTEYIELFARIFELELNEYIKRKTARGTATSTATPAESVDYNALLRQRAPDIAEAMDILNAPKQANESQQDYERWQNAARRQSNTSGMPRQALSEVETATSHPAGEDEMNIVNASRLRRRNAMKAFQTNLLRRNMLRDESI